MKHFLLLVLLTSFGCSSQNTKPAVWIYSDMSDPSIPGKNHMGTVNDPDDVSAMAGYLLIANEFETKGIVIASTHRSEHRTSNNQQQWANEYFKKTYEKEVQKLNKEIGGFPNTIDFQQSSIKETGERFDPNKDYKDLTPYTTVQSLIDALTEQKEVMNVLCWGSLTEPAIFVKHCLSMGKTDLLKQVRFIAHWTNSTLHQGTIEHPEHVANCREDSQACSFLKETALAGQIEYYECGAIGQHGIVSGSPKGDAYYDQFKISGLGKIFSEGKYVNESVDHSDAATYWVLLGTYGVSLTDIANDGTNDPELEKANELRFRESSERIHNELLRRAKIAAGE